MSKKVRYKEMTSNQIAYWVNEEKKRSNLVMEAENKRHNLEQEKIGRSQAAASYLGAQASMMNASTNAANLAELQRHNLATEGTSQYGAETGRFSSVVSALLGTGELDVKRRSVSVQEELLPYQKAKYVTGSISDVAKSINPFGSVVSSLLDVGGN